jgi:hypothetical protein
VYDPEQRERIGRAARLDAEALCAADDLLRSDLGRSYAHQTLAAQHGLEMGDPDDIEFVAGTLDGCAAVLAAGASVHVVAGEEAVAAKAGWALVAEGNPPLAVDLAASPAGVAWFEEPVEVRCGCGASHPDVAGVAWRSAVLESGEPGVMVYVVGDSGPLGQAGLPRFVLDSTVLFDDVGIRAHQPLDEPSLGSLEWAAGVARWALRAASPASAER